MFEPRSVKRELNALKKKKKKKEHRPKSAYIVFTTQSRLLATLYRNHLKTLWKKEKNAGFPTYQRYKSIFEVLLLCRLQMLSVWTSVKICRLVRS